MPLGPGDHRPRRALLERKSPRHSSRSCRFGAVFPLIILLRRVALHWFWQSHILQSNEPCKHCQSMLCPGRSPGWPTAAACVIWAEISVHPARDVDEPPALAARFLEAALLFTFIIHAVAMVSMAFFSCPACPAGGAASVTARAAYVAGHPWLWRLGWLPWQLTALSDLLLGFALLQTPWVPRFPAILTFGATLLGILPDQYGQAVWITHGVHLARQAVDGSDLAAYAQFENRIFIYIAGWGAAGYLLGALGWTWCFAAARTWNRGLSWLSLALLGVFAFATAPVFLPLRFRPNPLLVSGGNALAFVLLQIWFIGVGEKVLGRSRRPEKHGDMRHGATPRAARGAGFARCWATAISPACSENGSRSSRSSAISATSSTSITWWKQSGSTLSSRPDWNRSASARPGSMPSSRS